ATVKLTGTYLQRVLERTPPPLCTPLSCTPLLVLNDQEKRLVFTNKPKIHPGPLFNCTLLVTEVPNLRIEPLITGFEFVILAPLPGNRLLKRPHLGKTTLPNPQAHLQQENENDHNGP